MAGFATLAAIAAQVATQTGTTTTPPSSTDTTAPAAQLGKSTYVDLEGGAGYSSNPLMRLGSGNGAAYGRISAHVAHTRISERTTTVLSGFAQGLFYTRHFGADESFDISARHDAAVNEALRVFIDGDASYDRGGQLDTQILTIPNVPLLPGNTVPPPLLTPGSDFLTVTGRSYRLRADTGGSVALSLRDSLTFTSGVEHDVLKSGVLDTRYTSVPLSLGYNRELSPRTTVGARVVAQFTHYSGDLTARSADVRVITPEVTGQMRLSERLTFSGDVGVSFASVDDGVTTRHSTGLAGDANLCSSSERSSLCARASIQQQAATSAGPARSLGVGIDYSRRLTEFDTLQLSVGADRYSNPVILVSGEAFNRAIYMRGVVNYSHRISDRWFGGVNLSARKVTQTGPDPNADLAASIFVRYRFGDLR
jgi:hypothetical protein